jgi:hypothetical protein
MRAAAPPALDRLVRAHRFARATSCSNSAIPSLIDSSGASQKGYFTFEQEACMDSSSSSCALAYPFAQCLGTSNNTDLGILRSRPIEVYVPEPSLHLPACAYSPSRPAAARSSARQVVSLGKCNTAIWVCDLVVCSKFSTSQALASPAGPARLELPPRAAAAQAGDGDHHCIAFPTHGGPAA